MPSKRLPKPPVATHLTATMRVLRAHFARPAITVAEVPGMVKELAWRLGTGAASRDDQVLEEKLRKATRISVADLAHYAEDWPIWRPAANFWGSRMKGPVDTNGT